MLGAVAKCFANTLAGYLGRTRTKETELADTKTYTVPAIHCGHCAAAIKQEVSGIAGVHAVDVDLDAKLVTIRGEALSDEALREAIEEAGYEAA
jgi:copper chaperone CopZ